MVIIKVHKYEEIVVETGSEKYKEIVVRFAIKMYQKVVAETEECGKRE